MFNWSLFILPALFLFSCNQPEKTQRKRTDIQSIYIDFASAQAEVPDRFVVTSIDEYKRRISESTLTPENKEITITEIESLRNNPYRYMLMLDTVTYLRTLLFQENKHIVLTKSSAGQIFGILEAGIKPYWEQNSLTYKRIENKLMEGRKLKVAKLKYELTSFTKVGYKTLYLVSGPSKLMGIIVTGPSQEDYEDLFLGIKIN
jgi:hypothetical protein